MFLPLLSTIDTTKQIQLSSFCCHNIFHKIKIKKWELWDHKQHYQWKSSFPPQWLLLLQCNQMKVKFEHLIIYTQGWHSCAVGKFQLPVWSLHVLLVSVWVPSGFYEFLPHSKGTHVRLGVLKFQVVWMWIVTFVAFVSWDRLQPMTLL